MINCELYPSYIHVHSFFWTAQLKLLDKPLLALLFSIARSWRFLFFKQGKNTEPSFSSGATRDLIRINYTQANNFCKVYLFYYGQHDCDTPTKEGSDWTVILKSVHNNTSFRDSHTLISEWTFLLAFLYKPEMWLLKLSLWSSLTPESFSQWLFFISKFSTLVLTILFVLTNEWHLLILCFIRLSLNYLI